MKKKKILSENEVKHISQLAKLHLTPKEVKKYQQQLTKIFDYIDLIAEIKTNNVAETSHATGKVFNIFREDRIDKTKMLNQEEALSNSSSKLNGFFRIKAIFSDN